MATELTYYINLASTSGGDGTTNNIVGTDRAWAGIAEAVTGLQANHSNLITEDVNITVEITGNGLDTAVTYAGVTIMDATHTLTFIVVASSYHNWTKDTGYRCGQITLSGPSDYVFFNGLAITGGANAGILAGLNNPNGDNLLVYANYYGLSGSGTYNNCLVVDNNSRGVYANSSTGVITANKCTSEGNANAGFRGAPGTVNATDCYSGNNVNGDYLDTVVLNTCASSDATGSAGLQNISITSAFVDPNNGDYTPIVGGPLDGTASDGGDIGAIQLDAGGSYDLTPNDIINGLPTLGHITISQGQLVAPSSLTSGVPTLGQTIVSQIFNVSPNNLVGSIPVLDSVTMTQSFVLYPDDISSGVPTLGSITASQEYVLVPNPLFAGVPTLYAPLLAQPLENAVPIILNYMRQRRQ